MEENVMIILNFNKKFFSLMSLNIFDIIKEKYNCKSPKFRAYQKNGDDVMQVSFITSKKSAQNVLMVSVSEFPDSFLSYRRIEEDIEAN